MSNPKEFDPPPYMQAGSKGPVVTKVLLFIAKWAGVPTGMTLDSDDTKYDGKAVEWVKRFQSGNGLEPDGGFGPATRSAAAEQGFDFVAVANKAGKRLTAFVQPNGKTLYWAPGTEPNENRHQVEMALNRLKSSM